MVVPPERRGEIVKMLRSLIEPICVSGGCLRCRLLYDARDENNLCWEEEWQSSEGLYRHIASTRYRQILAALDLAVVEPEIRFEHVSDARGMDLISSIRSNGNCVIAGSPRS